jgi:SAM-dependent methyltransferase
METVAVCPVCTAGLAGAAVRCVVDSWRIVACPGCGLGVTTPRPSLAEIGKYYKESFFLVRPDATIAGTVAAAVRGRVKPSVAVTTLRSILLNEIKTRHDWTAQGGAERRRWLTPLRVLLGLTYEPIQTIPPVPGRILDIGFGRGEFLLRAKRLGWESHGVEVSPKSVEWGRSLGLQVKPFDGSFTAPLDYPDGMFDAVSANSVLEHVHHPRQLVAEGRRLLRPGGTFMLMVPNFECRDIELLGAHWRMWSPPQHLFHFTAANVRALLEAHGFGEIRVRYKVWFNPMTDRFSLRSIRPTVTPGEYRRIAWRVRFGKRIDYLCGRRTAAEVAPGMAIEAVRR